MYTGIYYNQPYALFFKDIGKYLRYGRQGEGAVNLVWSDEAGYEWVFRKPGLSFFTKNRKILSGDEVGLLNIVAGLEEGGSPQPSCYLVHLEKITGLERLYRGVALTWNRIGAPYEDYHGLCEWAVSDTSSGENSNLRHLHESNSQTQRYLHYDESQTEGIELGWTADRPACLQALPSSTRNLILKSVTCQVAKKFFSAENFKDWPTLPVSWEPDNISIIVNHQTIWGPYRLNNGHTYHLQDVPPVSVLEGDLTLIQIKGEFVGDIESTWEYMTPGEYSRSLGELWSLKTDAAFLLIYSVEEIEQSARLEIVCPSLGHPLILKPNELRSFTVKVATSSIGGDITVAIENLRTAIVLEDAQTHETWPCLADVAEGISYTIERQEEFYRNLRERLNKEPGRFPRTNDEFRAGCGIVSDFDVTVTPKDIDELVNTLTAEDGKPRMFNLHLGDSSSYHSIFVSKLLPHAQNISFLQITDIHITQRNDIVPRAIDMQLDLEFQRDILRRRHLNPNDHLRAIIRYANEKFEKGEINFVVLTGDIVDYVSEYDWDDWGASRSNFVYFREIITGQDGIGERLHTPIFIIPGNHEFYPLELPLRWVQRVYLCGKRSMERSDGLKAAGLRWNTEYEDDPFGFYSKLLSNAGKGFGAISEAAGYRLLVQSYSYSRDYLTEISYDIGFTVTMGEHQLILLNTGEDAGRPSIGDIKDAKIWGPSDDYLEHGSHCAGFSTEDVATLRSALSNPKVNGLIFVFTHAPLIHLENTPLENNQEFIFERDLRRILESEHQRCKDSLPNKITKFFWDLAGRRFNSDDPVDQRSELFWFSGSLRNEGFPQGRTRYFKSGDRNYRTDFGCAGLKSDGKGSEGGYADEVMNLLMGWGSDIAHKCAAVFSGHTHHINEYRVGKEDGRRCFYTDNYSGTVSKSGEDITKAPDKFPEMPPGNANDHLPKHQHEIAKWLGDHAPLLLISGGLKGKKRPQFREIHVKSTEGFGIESMQMIQIDRWSVSRPVRGLEHLWITESIGIEFLRAVNMKTMVDSNEIKSFISLRRCAARAIAIGTNSAPRALINRFSFAYRNWPYGHLSKLSQESQNELDRLLLELAGHFAATADRPLPEWFERSAITHASALFYAVSAVRLSRLGVRFSYPTYDSLDLCDHYEWALFKATRLNHDLERETASSAESVGEFRLGEVAEGMV